MHRIQVKILKIRILFILTCLSFLLFQSWLILSQYLNDSYVTNIKFIREYVSSLPAYTICYDRYLSLEALFERFPDIDLVKDWKDNYTQLMSRVDQLNYDRVDGETWQLLDEYDKMHQKLQDEMMNQMKPPYIYPELTSYQDFLANITIRGTYLENNQTKYFYSPWVTGHVKNFWHENYGLMYLLNNALDIAPIESMYYIGDKQRKCFTFFSQLEKRFRDMRANLKKVYMNVPFVRDWFPYRKEYEIYLSIHSPKIIPDINTFTSINELGDYNIIYSKLDTQAKLGVLTCTNYELNYKHGNFNMKSDCIFQCLGSKLNPNCHLLIMEKFSYVPFRNTLFPDGKITNPCQINNDEYKFKEEECSSVCLDECHQEYYFQEIKLTRREPTDILMLQRSIKLNFIPSSLPKIIVTHLPEMTFMTLFCNFCGLLGMWLGVSMLTTMQNTWHVIKHAFNKYKSYDTFNNNNIYITYNQYNLNVNGVSSRRKFPSYSRTSPRLPVLQLE